MTIYPTLYLVIPCYNEEDVLPITIPLFTGKMDGLKQEGRISNESRILFVDDGSTDETARILEDRAARDPQIRILTMACNRGQQEAILAGLYEAEKVCDIAISADCDGQHDPEAIDDMFDAYEEGAEIVYGVRRSREGDSFFKRSTAKVFYMLMRLTGRKSVRNHADYRLVSRRVIQALPAYIDGRPFLRAVFPRMPFPSATVIFDCGRRLAGTTKYSLIRMTETAFHALTDRRKVL